MNTLDHDLNEAAHNALKTYLKLLREKKITAAHFNRYLEKNQPIKELYLAAQKLQINPKLLRQPKASIQFKPQQPLTLQQKIHKLLFTEIPLPSWETIADFLKEPTNWRKNF